MTTARARLDARVMMLPRMVFFSIVGIVVGMDLTDCNVGVGVEVQCKRGVLTLNLALSTVSS